MAAEPREVPGGVLGLDVSLGGQHWQFPFGSPGALPGAAGVRVRKLDTTAALVHEHGLAPVTMSQIAAATGIGRATLYKHFPDVEAILMAWHDRQIARHLRQLTEARDAAGTPVGQLEAVLEAYALIQHQHHGTELPVSLLHRGEHVARARQQLQDLVAGLLAAGARVGGIRSDITPGELAGYCLHALAAAGGLPSEAAVRRLLAVTMSGLRPQPAG